jgi:anaerobic magnesium-protoporphyrin IX monomethyl ester cyclase
MICGGHHASAMPEQMLSIGYDQVVQGEGENAIISIIEGNKEKIVKNVEYKYFKGINEIPFPDYTGINFGGCIGISIITSRGCPFACNFCASSDFWNRKYKYRSPDNVLAEVEKIKSQGFTSWIFEDDNFTANKRRTFEICKHLDGKYFWQCVSRAESLDEDLCKEMYRAGCRMIWIGIESFSQEALNRCNKKTTVEKMMDGLLNARNAGIDTISLFLIGLPGDTQKDIDITVAKIKEGAINGIGVNIAWILPNTEIYRKAKEYGFDDNVYLESGAPFYTYEHDINTLRTWEKQIEKAKQ